MLARGDPQGDAIKSRPLRHGPAHDSDVFQFQQRRSNRFDRFRQDASYLNREKQRDNESTLATLEIS